MCNYLNRIKILILFLEKYFYIIQYHISLCIKVLKAKPRLLHCAMHLTIHWRTAISVRLLTACQEISDFLV